MKMAGVMNMCSKVRPWPRGRFAGLGPVLRGAVLGVAWASLCAGPAIAQAPSGSPDTADSPLLAAPQTAPAQPDAAPAESPLPGEAVSSDAQTVAAGQAVAAAVRDEVQTLYSEIKTLRDSVTALQDELRQLRTELAAQRQAQAEQPGFFRRTWNKLKEQAGKIWR